jgi:hypothetical protein
MVPPQTQVQAPVRSLDQRMEALKRANDIRVKRAQLKKDLKSGSVSIEQILREPPEFVSDRKGLRHVDGGPEVRPREGCAFCSTSAGSASRRRSAVSPTASDTS